MTETATVDDFDELVNLSARQLDDGLKPDDSKSVGQTTNGGESTGHHMGREIVRVLKKTAADYADDHHADMTCQRSPATSRGTSRSVRRAMPRGRRGAAAS